MKVSQKRALIYHKNKEDKMRKYIWLLVISLLTISLIVSSCGNPTAKKEGETQIVTGQVSPTQTTTAATTTTVPTTTATVSATPVSGWLADVGFGKTPTTAIGTPVYGGTITVTGTSDWTVFDVYRYQGNSQYFGSGVFEKLSIGDWTVDRNVFNFPDDSGVIPEAFSVPCLLESWEFPDNLTIIMHVRPGIKWQNKPPVNGRAFTADDVVWNLTRYKDDPFVETTYFKMIDSITKIDGMTVQVKLKSPPQPFSQFGLIDSDTHHYVPPECVVASSNQIEDWRKVIGTGPWIVSDFVSNSSVSYVKNPDYWREDPRHPGYKLPYADKQQVLIIPDLGTRLAALRVGRIDKMGAQYKDAKSIMDANKNVLVRAYPNNSMPVIRMRNDIAPFTDVRVRNACQMAMNLEEIKNNFYLGQALMYSPVVTFVQADLYTPYEKLPDSVKKNLTYNVQGAKKLLADAGFPNGFKTDLTYDVLNTPGLAEVVQAYLAAIGVTVELKGYDNATFNAIRLAKKHQGMIQHWNWNTPSPILLLNVMTDPTHIFNLSVCGDPEYKALMAKVNVEWDPVKRTAMIHQADYMTLEKSFYITLPQNFIFLMWHPWLRGFTGETNIGKFQYLETNAYLWLDQGMKKQMTGK